MEKRDFESKIKQAKLLIASNNYEQARELLTSVMLDISNELDRLHEKRNELVRKVKMDTGVKIAVDKEKEAFSLVFDPKEDSEKEDFFKEYNNLMEELNKLENVLTQAVVLMEKVEEEIRLQERGL